MATCSITESFVADADTFFTALDAAQEIAEDKKAYLKTTHEKVDLLKSEEIKKIFGSK